MLFTSERWNRQRRTGDPSESGLINHVPTETLETGFEETTAFVPAWVVATLLDKLFLLGVLSIEDLREILDDQTLECVTPGMTTEQPTGE